jgi:hypothetical protein
MTRPGLFYLTCSLVLLAVVLAGLAGWGLTGHQLHGLTGPEGF